MHLMRPGTGGVVGRLAQVRSPAPAASLRSRATPWQGARQALGAQGALGGLPRVQALRVDEVDALTAALRRCLA